MLLLLVVAVAVDAATHMKGITKQCFKRARERFGLKGAVQIHHIIPRQFGRHPVLADFAFEDGQNYMLMPTREGKVRLRTARLCHEGGHCGYNRHVGKRLEEIYRGGGGGEGGVDDLLASLRRNLTSPTPCIPWE